MKLLDLLFPPACPFCEALLSDGERPLCAKCRKTLPWTEGASSRQTGRFFTACYSPLYYRDGTRESVLRFKFGRRPGYAAAYAGLIAPLFGPDAAGRYDFVTWVPVSRRRLRSRGYDQSRLLAAALAKALSLPCRPALRKIRHNPPQSGIGDPGARRANVLGAYEVTGRLDGQRILLVDDVITTGATLSECAAALLTAGAAAVDCATLARSAVS